MRKRTYSEESMGWGDRCKHLYVTEPILKTSSLPRSLVCLLLLERTLRGTYASSPRALLRLSSRTPDLLQDFLRLLPYGRAQPDNSAHVRRKAEGTERGSCQASRKSKVEKPRDKSEIGGGRTRSLRRRRRRRGE